MEKIISEEDGYIVDDKFLQLQDFPNSFAIQLRFSPPHGMSLDTFANNVTLLRYLYRVPR